MHSEYQFPEQPEQGDVPVEVPDPSGPPVPVEEAISWSGMAVAALSFVARCLRKLRIRSRFSSIDIFFTLDNELSSLLG